MTCKVSVLVPSYNYGSMIERCIRSVLQQDHPDFELVISDDASTDDSDAVIRSFGDPRIRYELQPCNLGMVPNWRKCVELARGDYLLLLGADDYLRPGMLRACASVLDSDKRLAYCHTAAEFFRDDGRVIAATGAFQRSYVRDGVGLLESFLKGQRVVCSTAMFRRSEWEALGGWSPEWRNCMDLDLWFRMMLQSRVGFVGKVLVGFRSHPVLPSWQIMQAREDLRFLASMFERLPASHAHLRGLESGLRHDLCARWLATLETLPQTAARDESMDELRQFAMPQQSPAALSSRIRSVLKERAKLLLARLPDEARYRLGDRVYRTD